MFQSVYVCGTILGLVFGFLGIAVVSVAFGPLINIEGRRESPGADHFDSSNKGFMEGEQENLSVQRWKRETGFSTSPLFRAECRKCSWPLFLFRPEEKLLHTETFTDSKHIVRCRKCHDPVSLSVRCPRCKTNYVELGSSKLAGSGAERLCHECQEMND